MTAMFRTLAAAALFVAALAASASAQSDVKALVDQAERACVVGERVDGFLGVVKGATPDDATLRAMNEINIKRRALYDKLADEKGVSLEVVARLTGEKQVSTAKEGECVLDDSGEWKAY